MFDDKESWRPINSLGSHVSRVSISEGFPQLIQLIPGHRFVEISKSESRFRNKGRLRNKLQVRRSKHNAGRIMSYLLDFNFSKSRRIIVTAVATCDLVTTRSYLAFVSRRPPQPAYPDRFVPAHFSVPITFEPFNVRIFVSPVAQPPSLLVGLRTHIQNTRPLMKRMKLIINKM